MEIVAASSGGYLTWNRSWIHGTLVLRPVSIGGLSDRSHIKENILTNNVQLRERHVFHH